MRIFYSHFYYSLLVYKSKFYLQVYLYKCAYRQENFVVDNKMLDYLGDNPFEYKCCIMIELI